MVKRLTRLSSQKPTEQPPEQTGSEQSRPEQLGREKVLEQVPAWLKMLLTKYGETEGPLVGLEAESFEEEALGPPSPTAEEEGHLSNILEQMAQEGLEPAPGHDVPTSVEWRAAAAEPPAAPIDDVLASIDTAQEEDYDDAPTIYDQPSSFEPEAPATGVGPGQDYGQSVQMPMDFATPAQSAPPQAETPIPVSGAEEVPDWLTEALEAPPTDTEIPPSPPPEAQPSPSVSEEEVPDWLTEALEEPSSTPAPTESQQPFPSSPTEQEIPGWLTEPPPESGDLASGAVEPTETTYEAEAGQPEVPDWLTDMDIPTAGVLGPSPESAAPEPDTLAPEVADWQVPDWITEGIEDVSGQEEIQQKPEAEAALTDHDIPDWIAQEQPPAAEGEPSVPEAETSEIPDWLMSVDKTPAPTVSSPPPAPVETAEPSPTIEEIPDWLTPDSEASIQADILSEAESGVTEAELPGQSFATPAPTEEPPVVTTEQPLEPQPPSGPPQDGRDLPTWLQNIQTESPSSIPPAGTPKWLENFQVSSETPAMVSDQPPHWLKSVQVYPDEAPLPTPVTEEGEAPGVSETTVVSPDSWLTDLEAPPTGDTPAVAATTETIPTADTDDWLADLEAPPVGETPAITPTAETPPVSDTDDWLADLEAPPAEETAAASTAEMVPAADTDDWLVDLEAPSVGDTPAAEAESEIPSWLSELPDVETEQPTAAPAEPAAEGEVEIPAWLTETEETPAKGPPAAPAEPTAEAEAETLPWLSELPKVETEQPPTAPTEPAAETEFEMPAWLSEEAAPTETPPATPAEPAAETDAETLSWLSELPKVEAEQPAASPTEPAAEAEVRIPDWLFEEETPAETPPAAPVEPAAEAEAETPTWLSELPEVETEQPAAALTEPAAEEEVEIPAWLSEVEETPAEGLPPAATAAPSTEAEAETLSWLSELSEVETEQPAATPTEPAAEAEFEMPAWLSEEAAPTATPPLAPAEPTAETEAETPPWLSELPEVETEQPAATPTEPAAETEAGIPDWLFEEEMPAETPSAAPAESAAETEAETPTWLSELPEVEAEQPAAVPTEPAAETEFEMPAWLPEEEAPVEEPPAAPAEPTAEAESEMPAWLSELPEAPQTGPLSPPPEGAKSPEAEAPTWLSDMPRAPDTGLLSRLREFEETDAESETPSWPSESPEVGTEQPPVARAESTAETEVEIPDRLSGEETPAESTTGAEPEIPWLSDSETALAEESATAEESAIDEEPEWPSWLSESAETSSESDDTLLTKTESEVTDTEDLSSDSSESARITGDQSSSDQDWLSGLREATEAVEATLPPEERDKSETQPPPSPPKTDETKPDTDLGGIKASQASAPSQAPTTSQVSATSQAPATSSTAKSSSWLQALKPTETATAVEDSQATEATGVLAGLTGLLPAEKLVTAIPAIEPQPANGQAEAILEAARDFYTIATQTPQPATLPTPLTQQRKQLMGGVARALVYVLFIILVALPLLPGIQSETGRQVPWTEPSGELNEVLGKQRRLLVSEELGVIDLQQPGSVALVSFDFTTATQGEMQPLAEAIVGRLRGQGMRIIFVSLEPEGAALAQEILDQERDEAYGVDMVNLGYLPGQIVGIRQLATGRKSLSTVKDFKEGLTFESAERAGWSDVNNLSQIDVVVTLADNPTTARWWIEQMEMAINPDGGERFLLAATSATAAPFLQPYRDSDQLDGLIAGINGAAAIESGRKQFGSARQMLDSQSIAHLFIVILIAAGTIAGWMPPLPSDEQKTNGQKKQPEETG